MPRPPRPLRAPAPTPVWIVMCRDLSGAVSVAGTPRVVAALVVEAETALVLGTRVADDRAEALQQAFAMALTGPPGVPAMGPPVLVVCPRGSAGEVTAALRAVLPPGELPPVSEQDPVAGAEDIFDALIGHLAGRGPVGEPPEPDDWSAAVGAALDLRQRSPWDRWDDTVPLDVELGGTEGDTRYRCVVLGAAGEQLGLVMFPGWAWPPLAGGWGGDEPVVPPEGTLMLLYDRPDEVPAELVARAERYGWPADDEVVPLFGAIGPDGPVEADRPQVRRMAAGAAAVAAHDRRGPMALGADGSGTTTTGTVDLAEAQVTFSVRMGPVAPDVPAAPPRSAPGRGAGPRTRTGRRAGAGAGATGATGRDATGARIGELLQAFLDEQRSRLAPKTFRSYETVIGLLTDCLNGYGYQSLGDAERARWDEAYAGGNEDAFVQLFGAAELADNLGEFFGYFMVRKVMAGRGLLRSAGTVTKKLVRWLADRGELGPAVAAEAEATAAAAARDLPRADELAELLWEQTRWSMDDLSDVPDNAFDEGLFTIERVESGKVWFEGGRGPVRVTPDASDLAEPGWSITATLVRRDNRWHLVEVGNVYP